MKEYTNIESKFKYWPLYQKLLFFYILCCAIPGLVSLPFFDEKLQLTEIIFLILIMVCYGSYALIRRRFAVILYNSNIANIIHLSLFFIILQFFTSFFFFNQVNYFETVGRYYLLIVFAISLVFFCSLGRDQLIRFIENSFISVGVFTCILGLIAYSMSCIGFENKAAMMWTDYPYFGNVIRLQSFTPSPAYFISIITPCAIFCLHKYHRTKKLGLLFCIALFILCSVLSYSKSIIILSGSLLAFQLFYCNKSSLSYWLILFTFIAHLFVTHFIVRPTNLAIHPLNSFVSDEVAYKTSSFQYIGTCYYALKKAALKMLPKNPIFGIGSGNFNSHLQELKTVNEYPQHLPDYDPHSTIFGCLAENGIFGAILFIAILGLMFYMMSRREMMHSSFGFALVLVLLCIIMESVSMDILNFRHYWIIFAIICSYYFYMHLPKKEN